MVSSRSLRLAALLLASVHAALAQDLQQMTYVGCFSSNSGLNINAGTDQYQTEGSCQATCVRNKNSQAVLGLTNKDSCYCGNQAPPTSAKVDDSKCSFGCNGFGTHPCGGPGFYTVYLTGTQSSVSAVGGGTISAGGSSAVPSIASQAPGSTATTSAGPTVVTSILPGQTVTTTASPDNSNNASASPTAVAASGPNVGAIAGGVVVGVIVLALIIGAIFFVRRRRQKQAADEEQRRTQVADFMGRESKSSSAMTASTASKPYDSRFDAEAMAHRRLSDGSIADNEDYSRRILKVTNA